VFGLEARREFDMGELRQRRRLALPVVAGLGGLIVPVAIYLAVNHGSAARGWGAAMSTDTAFALGMLALTQPRFPDRVRAFLLSVAVVDDLVSLVVIGTAYSQEVRLVPLAVAAGVFAVVLAVRRAGIRVGLVYALLGITAWVAVLKSGIDPVVVGLVMGLLTYAYPASRTDLERASDLFRSFREQPTPELARSAGIRLASALSPNERLQLLYHPWTSFVIVPLFALANAGIVISGSFLARAYTSPITLGILIGYVVGKPAGITGASWLLARLSRGRLRPPVGWAAVAGVGTIAGVGFTVSILIATLAFSGTELQEAKLGVLSTVLGASAVTWLVFRATALLPARLQIRALLGTTQAITDLGAPVDPGRDHIRGPDRAIVTIVEYGDFECPYCGQAEPVLRELLAGHGDVRYVWRHLPLTDVHPHAQLAAEASEAAADQGAFWPMHDLLLRHQDALLMPDLVRYAGETGIDPARFRARLARRADAARIAEDVDSADLSGVSGTPTFFINGRRHYGSYDTTALTEAVRAAKAARLATAGPATPRR
jgi:Na+/H+ antiporter NhaA/predicted DsbA family dithiol-disulfide isomerase